MSSVLSVSLCLPFACVVSTIAAVLYALFEATYQSAVVCVTASDVDTTFYQHLHVMN